MLTANVRETGQDCHVLAEVAVEENHSGFVRARVKLCP